MFGLLQRSYRHKYILEEYACLAPRYDNRWSFYIEATIRETMKRLNLRPFERLLDIGCGTGAFLDEVHSTFPGIEAAGIDPSQEMLDVARQKLANWAELSVGWSESLPYDDNTFDIVVSCNSFHFWQKPVTALTEIARVLKPDGKLAITDWCHDYFACRICDLYLRLFNRAHFKTYGVNKCKELFTSAGFVDVNIEQYKINWLWGMMTATAKTMISR